MRIKFASVLALGMTLLVTGAGCSTQTSDDTTDEDLAAEEGALAGVPDEEPPTETSEDDISSGTKAAKCRIGNTRRFGTYTDENTKIGKYAAVRVHNCSRCARKIKVDVNNDFDPDEEWVPAYKSKVFDWVSLNGGDVRGVKVVAQRCPR